MTLTEFIIYTIVAFIVGRIYVIGKYVKSVNTMFHEDGHALFGLIFGRGTEKIELFYNTEGVAETLTTKGIRGWIPRMLIALAGYPFASFMAFAFFYLFTKEQYDILFYGLAGVIILNLLLWVRNFYGIIWLISFFGILAGLFYLGEQTYINIFLKFIGSVMFAESIFSSFIIMKLSFTQPNDAGDATSMRNNTMISARIWGILFFVQSLYFGYLIITKFIII